MHDWNANRLTLESTAAIEAVPEPGRPAQPVLVSPRVVERRKVSRVEGRAALIHSLAHIEFNAVNLALDAVYRFRGLPRDYYGDWIRVAAEEAYHFTLLRDHLVAIGFNYGSFTAHNGLWEMAVKTAHDPLVRMALVPRLLEARGLDAAPTLVAKLKSGGDARAVEILQIIQRDEVGHVEIGTRWYRHFCEIRGLSPLETFKSLLGKYLKGNVKGPYDTAMRKKAGFTDDELSYLEQMGAK